MKQTYHDFNTGAGASPEVVVLKVSHMFMKNNNYLIVDSVSRRAVVVDPAWQIEKIERALNDCRADLCGVLITHSHPDHIHLAKPVAEKYDCPIWMSGQEVAVSGFSSKQLVVIDETPLRIGSMSIQPTFTPGHTPGCFCYQIGDNLFTGDVLFAEGCGMCPDVRSAHDMFSSLEYLKNTLSPKTRIYPGHTYLKPPGQMFADLLQYNIYLQFTDREAFAAFRLRSGQNMLRMFDFA